MPMAGGDPKKLKQAERPVFEIIEAATHLLRRAPAEVLASYFLGAIPFTLAFLYYWADMSRSNQAQEYHAEAAFAMAVLFAWMKLWQSVFANQLTALMQNRELPRWTPARLARMGLVQTIIQSSGFILLPISALIMLPLGWAYAFYQNATALADGENVDVSDICKRSLHQAHHAPRQNHFLMSILSLFACFVWLNAASVAFIIPQLLKIFFGVETVFTQSPNSLLNTTFLAAISVATYLCVDPLFKAVYVVRCFYGDAVQSGGDLRVELRTVEANRAIASAVLAVVLCLAFAAPSISAAEPAVEKPDAPVNAAELDRAISEVMERREFTWRMPREKTVEEAHTQGLIDKFVHAVFEFIITLFKWIGKTLKAIIDWIMDKLSFGPTDSAPGVSTWTGTRIMVLAILLAAIAVLLRIAWLSMRKRARPPIVPVEAQAMTKPDLSDESLVADQLPEDGWLKMADEMFGKGDLRLALRALYLASLASLARRELIVIAKYKSNRDYDIELNRRARKQVELLSAFSTNVSTFERVWYGRHPTTPELFQDFRGNVEKMKERKPV